jgi:hypothetical protein
MIEHLVGERGMGKRDIANAQNLESTSPRLPWRLGKTKFTLG